MLHGVCIPHSTPWKHGQLKSNLNHNQFYCIKKLKVIEDVTNYMLVALNHDLISFNATWDDTQVCNNANLYHRLSSRHKISKQNTWHLELRRDVYVTIGYITVFDVLTLILLIK